MRRLPLLLRNQAQQHSGDLSAVVINAHAWQTTDKQGGVVGHFFNVPDGVLAVVYGW